MCRRLLCLLVIGAGTLITVDEAHGKVYKIIRPASYYDRWRQKRQSHPLATQVRIPEVAFADLTNDSGGGEPAGGGPLPVDYLTPPPPSNDGQQLPQQNQQLPQQSQQLPQQNQQLPPLLGQRESLPPLQAVPLPDLLQGIQQQQPQQQQQGGKWDLGYDANQILVPPAQQPDKYDTLKLFTLLPTSSNAIDSDPGFENAIKSILESQDSSPAGSSQEFTSSGEGQFRNQFQNSQEQYNRPNFQQQQHQIRGPVYTYVKTDREGHFKWGVRHGQR